MIHWVTFDCVMIFWMIFEWFFQQLSRSLLCQMKHVIISKKLKSCKYLCTNLWRISSIQTLQNLRWIVHETLSQRLVSCNCFWELKPCPIKFHFKITCRQEMYLQWGTKKNWGWKFCFIISKLVEFMIKWSFSVLYAKAKGPKLKLKTTMPVPETGLQPRPLNRMLLCSDYVFH